MSFHVEGMLKASGSGSILVVIDTDGEATLGQLEDAETAAANPVIDFAARARWAAAKAGVRSARTITSGFSIFIESHEGEWIAVVIPSADPFVKSVHRKIRRCFAGRRGQPGRPPTVEPKTEPAVDVDVDLDDDDPDDLRDLDCSFLGDQELDRERARTLRDLVRSKLESPDCWEELEVELLAHLAKIDRELGARGRPPTDEVHP